MRQKAEYKSSKRSRESIRKAFLELFKNKELSEISVTDIVKKAGINRATFYAHYTGVDNLMDEIGNEIIAKMISFLDKFEYEGFFSNPKVLLKEVCKYLNDNQEFYRSLWKGKTADSFVFKLQDIFVGYIKKDETIPKEIRESKIFDIRINHFAGGLANIFRKWFKGELNCELEDIAEEMGNMILNGKDF